MCPINFAGFHPEVESKSFGVISQRGDVCVECLGVRLL